MRLRRPFAATAIALLAGCAQVPPPPSGAAYTPVGFDALPGWDEDGLAAAIPPFLAECARFGSAVGLGGSGTAATLGGKASDWRPACLAARRVPAGDNAAARQFFEATFQPYALALDGNADGLFTGYWEPEVAGSLTRTGAFATPLRATPRDLVQADLGAFSPDLKGRRLTGRVVAGQFVPYPDRAAIDQGALDPQHLELLWLADPVDAFFLEIQGSGRVRLPDGSVIRITYAGQNGRPYVPIGRVLADRGDIPRDAVSMQSIRAWLAAHPQEAAAVMEANPSYVFFRRLGDAPADQGPPGALDVPLTPGRSAAVDRHYIPLGAPVWLDTRDTSDGTPFRRLLLAQDTGGAIKGPVRADIFFGWGADAETRAGQMRGHGRAFILLPRDPMTMAAR
jgi:membrane-bound lytic murein transglycosylase A